MVFQEVVESTDTHNRLNLQVRSETESDHHWVTGIGKAFLRGFTLGLATTTQSDHFDFSVSIYADLRCYDDSVAHYESQGSYTSEVPEVLSLDTKQAYVKQAVENSYEHAFASLASKLKDDRKHIESLECGPKPEKKRPRSARASRRRSRKRRTPLRYRLSEFLAWDTVSCRAAET